MTTFKARFTGNSENLKTFLVCGIKFPSSKRFIGNSLFIEWIYENEPSFDEAMNEIDIIQMESWGVNLESFFKSK